MKAQSSIHPGWIAGGIALFVAIWLLSGAFRADTDVAESVDANAAIASKKVKVRVLNSQAQPLMRQAIVSARTAPVRSVVLRAEINGRVSEVVAQRGQFLESGAVILRLAPRDIQAQLERAKAQLKQRQLQYEAAQKMAKQGLQSPVQQATAEANLRVAQAELQRLLEAQASSIIRAPFAGILDTRTAELGDYLSAGDLIGKIIQQDPFIVRGAVSEDVIGYLRAGQPASALLTDGSEAKGTLRYVASAADEGTRTFLVELEIANPSGRLVSGTSAVLMLPLEEVQAHVLEPASLALNERGEFGIKSVTEQGVVVFHKAQVAQNQGGQVWLSGLPAQLRIITVGQGFVSAGDAVDTVDSVDVVEADAIQP